MTYKIGIFGAEVLEDKEALPKIIALGQALGRHPELSLVTGGRPGVPFMAAAEAAKYGIKVEAFSPFGNLKDHQMSMPSADLSIFSKWTFMPKELAQSQETRVLMKFRNVTSTAACDAGIIIAGRWGSLNEFTNLVDMQKVVGVLTDTGGIADELPELCKKITKEGQGEVVFDDDPARLVEKILARLKP